MLKKLIVNADDFGLTEANTISTVLCHQDGIVTSTTLMINMPFVELAVKLAKENPTLGLGIHLVLTIGTPLVEGAKSYTDENGNFKKFKNYPNQQPCADPNELYVEWKAQIERFIHLVGRKPTHIDSHHHVHIIKEHLPVAIRLAKEYDVALRLRQEIENYDFEYAQLISNFYEDEVNIDYFLNIDINSIDNQICELMCHPSFIDERLLSISSYTYPRIKEMTVLRNSKVKEWIKANNIELINFTDLKRL